MNRSTQGYHSKMAVRGSPPGLRLAGLLQNRSWLEIGRSEENRNLDIPPRRVTLASNLPVQRLTPGPDPGADSLSFSTTPPSRSERLFLPRLPPLRRLRKPAVWRRHGRCPALPAGLSCWISEASSPPPGPLHLFAIGLPLLWPRIEMITRLKVDGFRSLSRFDMVINPGLKYIGRAERIWEDKHCLIPTVSFLSDYQSVIRSDR
jgi:hypothetical protein